LRAVSALDAEARGDLLRALDVSRSEYARLRGAGLVEEAPYALCLAFRLRYVLELDAREALHLIELRSGREGHPSYRAVAHERRRRDDVRRRLDRGTPGAAPRRDAERRPAQAVGRSTTVPASWSPGICLVTTHESPGRRWYGAFRRTETAPPVPATMKEPHGASGLPPRTRKTS